MVFTEDDLKSPKVTGDLCVKLTLEFDSLDHDGGYCSGEVCEYYSCDEYVVYVPLPKIFEYLEKGHMLPTNNHYWNDIGLWPKSVHDHGDCTCSINSGSQYCNVGEIDGGLNKHTARYIVTEAEIVRNPYLEE